MFYVTKINQNIIFAFLFIFLSCANEDPTLIQLPDTTAPSGYIVSPLNGSSVSGNTSLQVIAIDNEEVDTVYFMIKSQRDNSYRNVDSTTNVSNDIWSGKWNTQNSEWVENENYFITFKAVDLVGNEYIAPPVVVKLDNQDDEPPVGYIKNPITGQTVAGQVSIEVEASDNESALPRCHSESSFLSFLEPATHSHESTHSGPLVAIASSRRLSFLFQHLVLKICFLDS